jgi:hypothetical protein
MRKNFRGFTQKCEKIMKDLLATEFKSVDPKKVLLFLDGDDDLAAATVHLVKEAEIDDPDVIWINTSNEEGKAKWLAATDEEIKDTLRHEFLHIEIKNKNKSFGDEDDLSIVFILECAKRHIFPNDESIKVFEEQYGRGSFMFFWEHLPDNRKPILLGPGEERT